MNRFIEFIRRIFNKDKLMLNEGVTKIKTNQKTQKEEFLKNIRVEEEGICLLQQRIEQGIIQEESLSKSEINSLKELYSNQILNLVSSINSKKLKLN